MTWDVTCFGADCFHFEPPELKHRRGSRLPWGRGVNNSDSETASEDPNLSLRRQAPQGRDRPDAPQIPNSELSLGLESTLRLRNSGEFPPRFFGWPIAFPSIRRVRWGFDGSLAASAKTLATPLFFSFSLVGKTQEDRRNLWHSKSRV